MLNLELARWLFLLAPSSSGCGTGISSQWEFVMVDAEMAEERYEEALELNSRSSSSRGVKTRGATRPPGKLGVLS